VYRIVAFSVSPDRYASIVDDEAPCVRCGHAFKRHVGWNICRDCDCVGYRGYAPITIASIKVGDSFDVMGAYRGNAQRAVVTAVEGDAVVLRSEDGREHRVDREDMRTGRLRR
jgi:hypothetical protein